ncbi:MAG: MOSC domain-containing protein [Methylococcales bacterium]|nr:MOSC domain-containing protein [Methylococcales bacterium]
MTVTLSGLYVYPIKSLGGFATAEWPLLKQGLAFDRQWMLVDADNHFLSQRRLAIMARLQTRIDHNQLIVTAPGQTDLTLPLAPDHYQQSLQTVIWGQTVNTWHLAPEYDHWFSQALQTDCKLVYQPDNQPRPVTAQYAKPGDVTTLTDGFPLLLVSEASLNQLNRHFPSPATMPRFRPNLVVKGNPAFAEDRWRTLQIGDFVQLHLVKPCSRCVIPALDPDTGQYDSQFALTLKKYRSWQGQIYFGQNAIHQQTGVLQIGDAITILATGSSRPDIRCHD